MSYELPRAAKLLVDVQSKYIGKVDGRLHKAGKSVKVQRSPANPGEFIIWFGKAEIAKVQALDLPNTIKYTDRREQY
ncbi:hypothetical protein [Burkholderia vietnamiensis]|uniref:hypothetical protein n=1 Tax=Burkholderia vietnamiensis TaxID=60552 RepID=UPI00158EE49E|nr:hypothetical protein [Burkholderia vietnamiensis]